MDIQFLYVLFLSTLSGAFLGVYISYVGFRISYGKVCLPVELRQKHQYVLQTSYLDYFSFNEEEKDKVKTTDELPTKVGKVDTLQKRKRDL